MADPKESPIRYLIKWSGAVFVVLIISIAGHCTAETFMVPRRDDTCPSKVAGVIVNCMGHGDIESLDCMVKGTEMLKVCPKNEPEAQ